MDTSTDPRHFANSFYKSRITEAGYKTHTSATTIIDTMD